jgi:predicted AlkP superfamily pyrophosphatase or phosphodiesterase
MAACMTAACVTAACQPAPAGPSADRPTLAVLLVIDQLRPDLLSRYDHLYVGGLRTLIDEGYRFTNATHDHAVTTTGPGHTTLSTGVYPTRHGIVGNAWRQFEDGLLRPMYSMEDLDSPILGESELPGRSPANIERRGIADWIADRDPDSRVVAISKKDRAAIGMATQARGEVYWVVERGSGFVTSEYYHSEYPAWIEDFNANLMPLDYSDTLWESRVPPEGRSLTLPDTSEWELEGRFEPGYTAFPHRAGDLVDAADPGEVNYWRWRYTPFPDRAVVSLALEAIEEFELGQRGSVDFLGVSLSQTDLVGHRFGPRSPEQLDNLLRLDSELDRLFSFLDDEVGAGRWVVAMSADHGVLGIPEVLAEEGVDARRLTRAERQEIQERIRDALKGAGEDGVPEDEATQDAVKATLVALPYIAAAYTFAEVERADAPDSFQVLFAHSHSRTRVLAPAAFAGVYVRYEPNTLTSFASSATHSSPYYYDRHVPLIFLGGTIRSGVSTNPVATVDVAPTLAWLTGTPAPDDLDGRVLESVVLDSP